MVRPNVRSKSGGGTTGDRGQRGARESVAVTNTRRALLALAIALCVHAVVAALVPGMGPTREPAVTTRVTLIHIEKRVPPPKPPRRHVETAVHKTTSLPVRTVALAPVHDKTMRRETLHRNGAVAPSLQHSNDKPAADTVAAASQGTGAGTNSGAGSTGDADAGAGAAGDRPCGYVEFADIHGSRYSPRTGGFYVDIRMSVHFSDGHAESVVLDYPFYYPSEAANPWSDRNRNDPSFPTLLQTPPPALAPSEPSLVQYVVAHSEANGTTQLRECPSTPPVPAAHP